MKTPCTKGRNAYVEEMEQLQQKTLLHDKLYFSNLDAQHILDVLQSKHHHAILWEKYILGEEPLHYVSPLVGLQGIMAGIDKAHGNTQKHTDLINGLCLITTILSQQV